jgi:hypothetical protein
LVFLETEIAKDNSDRLYIDATEGGAFKCGTKIMKLKEVISKYCNKSVPELNMLIPHSNEVDSTKYNGGINELKKLSQKSNNLKIDCKKQLSEIKKLEKNILNDKINLKEVFKKLRKKETIEQIIFKEDVIRTFLQGVLMMANINETALGNKENYDTAVEKIKINKNLMNSLIIGCDAVYKSINKIVHKMYMEK